MDASLHFHLCPYTCSTGSNSEAFHERSKNRNQFPADAQNDFRCLPSTTNGRIRWSFYNQIFEAASECEAATAARDLHTRNDQRFEMIDAQFGNTL